MASLVTRYANALFQLALEKGETTNYMSQAQLLCQTFEGEHSALRILTHPLIPSREKEALVDEVYGGKVNDHLLGFMKLAIAKNRATFIFPALKKLVELIKQHMYQVNARVVSAVELSEAQVAKLTHILAVKTGKKVVLERIVDPSKIGGLSIHMGGYFLDSTITTQLNNMKNSFTK